MMRSSENYTFGNLRADEEYFASETRDLHAAIAKAQNQITQSLEALNVDTVREDVAEYTTEFVHHAQARAHDELQHWTTAHPWRVVGACVVLGFLFGFRR